MKNKKYSNNIHGIQSSPGMASIMFLIKFVLLFFINCNLVTPRIAILKNYDLSKEKAISLNYAYTAPGLYKKPFIIDFSAYLKEMSNQKVDVEAVNSYTVGSYQSADSCKFQVAYSNFLNPKCKFVNSWFGVYFIFDDDGGKGKKFMLTDPKGLKDDQENFLTDSIIQIPSLDQKLINWSTHEGQKNFTWDDFEKIFRFERKSEVARSKFTDKKKREWLKLSGEYETVSALTDTKITEMGLLDSLRAYIGLPTDQVYKLVDPWYSFTLKGSLLTRYYQCKKNSFWAILYFNGSAFPMKDGTSVDYYKNTDISLQFEKMTDALELSCN